MGPLDILLAAALACAIALGAWTAMGEGMILHRLGRMAERLPAFIAKPLATCPRCMVSAWGIPLLIALGYTFGVELHLDPDVITDRGYLFDVFMPVHKIEPWVEVDWSELAKLPVVLLCATGLQELLHRP